MKKSLLFLIVLVLCISLTSCKPKMNLEDILSNATCDPPCWLGMTPGETTVEEAHQQLAAQAGVINQERIFDISATEAYPEMIGFEVHFSESQSYLYFENGRLSLIEIEVDDGKMEVENGVGLYGTPEEVIYQKISCPGRFFGDAICLQVLLHYPRKGLMLSYEQSRDSNILIVDPQEQIDLVYFYAPGSDPFSELTFRLGGERVIDWPGYTEIVDIWN
ncbi:hypothetical protein EH221_01990 [bacterium]|nr:MAG: hypothetical protein EH221_01990 [bacterium]